MGTPSRLLHILYDAVICILPADSSFGGTPFFHQKPILSARCYVKVKYWGPKLRLEHSLLWRNLQVTGRQKVKLVVVVCAKCASGSGSQARGPWNQMGERGGWSRMVAQERGSFSVEVTSEQELIESMWGAGEASSMEDWGVRLLCEAQPREEGSVPCGEVTGKGQRERPEPLAESRGPQLWTTSSGPPLILNARMAGEGF